MTGKCHICGKDIYGRTMFRKIMTCLSCKRDLAKAAWKRAKIKRDEKKVKAQA